MDYLRHPAVRPCLLLLLSLVFAGCTSIESGMRLESVPSAPEGQTAQQTPILKLITPTLIAEESADLERSTRQDIQGFTGTTKPYVIGNGDLLSILVWNYPELNIAAAGAQALSASGVPVRGAQSPSAYVVDQSGQIQFPYVGAIRVAGLTEMQARDLLQERLFRSIKKPDITLRVQDFRSKKVYVDGEVRSPGNQVIDDLPMTLLEALTRAGGLLPSADQSAIVISRGGASYPVNLPALVRQGINPSDILLAPGDVLRVRSRDENKIFVLGEVAAPRALPMVNGRLTLTEALGEAGGLNQLSAAGRQVYVVRNANAKEPLVYNLDARSPVALALADGFVLRPRDVVFVDASGLARFNRIVTLILPNAASATASYYNVNATR
ncbi:EPS I polysaccharide export outer membrane protein EpsA [Burkholderiales bacterium 8X]|nr:EPS I polysaccharide export outer membrane protein EpsA [Burkholderiales bacterium 8X]